jgi:hypothetical protein
MITLCGDSVSLDELREIPVIRPPRAGARWHGIRHYDLAFGILESLDMRGIEPVQTLWSVESRGQSFVGGVTVRLPDRLGVAPLAGMEYALGIRHTNDLRHALTFAVGARVLVCHNGLITGEFVLCRKHTSGINLDLEVDTGIERFVEEARGVGACVGAMRARSLTTRTSDHMLMEAGRRGLLPWSHIGRVQREYAAPRHAELAGRSAWSLYNAFTEVAKKANPRRQIRALGAFREIVLN